jgi:hypothetical protein
MARDRDGEPGNVPALAFPPAFLVLHLQAVDRDALAARPSTLAPITGVRETIRQAAGHGFPFTLLVTDVMLMRMFLGWLLVLLVISLVLIGVGIASGSLLRVVFPSVDRGMSILVGLVACVSAIHFLSQIVQHLPSISPPEYEDDEDDDDDDDDLGREPETIRPPVWILPPSDRPSRKRRRRRR